MTRQTSKLNALAVQRACAAGRISDGGGLYLQISRGGSKSWLFRFMLNGKPREMGLGPIALVTLSEARTKAIECRRYLLDGNDPIEARKVKRKQQVLDAAKSITFDQCAASYIASHRMGWKNVKHAKQWETTIATYASPVIGSLPVQDVTTELVRRVLNPIWCEKTETACRLRSRLELVLSWATVQGYRTGDNPARWRGHLSTLLPKRSMVQPVQHFAAMPLNKIGSFLSDLQSMDGIAIRALEFLILTAARTGEVIGAQWSEINFEEASWLIPASRMKAKREHRVPLSPRCIEIAKIMKAVGHDTFVFPGLKKGHHLSNMALLAVLKRMGYPVTSHGFRSTFRDWAAERTNFSREVAEAALAHSLRDKTEAAYRRGDLFLKRRQMMNEWEKFCSTKIINSGTVIEIQRGACELHS